METRDITTPPKAKRAAMSTATGPSFAPEPLSPWPPSTDFSEAVNRKDIPLLSCMCGKSWRTRWPRGQGPNLNEYPRDNDDGAYAQ